MLNLINKIQFNFQQFKKILNLSNKKIKIIFYSESKFYQKFSYSLIEFFSKRYPGQVYYVSSDSDDRIEDLEVNNFFVSNGLLTSFFFSFITYSHEIC